MGFAMSFPKHQPRPDPLGGRRKGAEPIGDLLGKLLAREPGLAREMTEAAWREAVGPEVAGMTSVRGVRDGVLTVEVASSALLQELATFYRSSILSSMRAK